MRKEGTKLVPLLEFKKMLVKELILEAEKLIPLRHKLHVIKKLNNSVFKTTQPGHIVVWINSDCNCAVCSAPGDKKEQKLSVTVVVCICIPKTDLNSFTKTCETLVIPQRHHNIFCINQDIFCFILTITLMCLYYLLLPFNYPNKVILYIPLKS